MTYLLISVKVDYFFRHGVFQSMPEWRSPKLSLAEIIHEYDSNRGDVNSAIPIDDMHRKEPILLISSRELDSR